MCTGHDSSSVHPKEGERRKGDKGEEERGERQRGNVQEKTAEDVKNDPGEKEREKQRDNRTLLRHRKRKHVTLATIKDQRGDSGWFM